MPTPTMSDEELDALFQRGAAAYPDEMPPAAWARMESQLDDAARTQQLRRKVGRFFAGELLLIALVFWQVVRFTSPAADPKIGYHQPATSQAVARPAATAPPEAAFNGSFATSILRRADTAPAPSANTAPAPGFDSAPGPDATTAAVPGADPRRSFATALPSSRPRASATLAAAPKAHESALAPAPASYLAALAPGRAARPHRVSATHLELAKGAVRQGEKTTSAPRPGLIKDAVSTEKGTAASLAGKQVRGKQQRKHPQPAASAGGRFAAAPRQATDLLPTTKLAQQASGGEPLDLLAGRVASLAVAQYPLPVLRQFAGQQPAIDTARPSRPRTTRPPYRVLVGVLAGPSFSGVRTAQSAELGVDYGLTLEYRFSPRWRVRGGLLSSQKRYQAASSDYEAPAAWQWFGGTYDLSANCRITEIPLDLRYDVLSKPAYTLFTSLGLNSLLMRNERYSYDWTANGQTFTKSAEVRKGSNHFLSALNVSVGFEKPLGQRWSAQVEPFWQFPLGGVGAGKVRLTSAGASFSLKFGLVK